jgi:hypothetical protein
MTPKVMSLTDLVLRGGLTDLLVSRSVIRGSSCKYAGPFNKGLA